MNKKLKYFIIIISILILFEVIFRIFNISSMPYEKYNSSDLEEKYPDYNTQGFRTDLIFDINRKNVCVIGNSMTYGWCIKEEDNWVSKINKDIKVNKTYKFHNLALPTWTFNDEIQLFKYISNNINFRCDHYIFMFTINEFRDEFSKFSEILVEPSFEENYKYNSILKFILKNSKLVRYFYFKGLAISATVYFYIEIDKIFESKKYKTILYEFNEYKDEITFIQIPLIPGEKDYEKKYSTELYKYFNYSNYNYYNLYNLNSNISNFDYRCSKTDIHYNEIGHEMIKQEVINIIYNYKPYIFYKKNGSI
jgi:hypothetical protein